MTTFPCPIGEAIRASGGGSGIGGQMITSCPICGAVSANTAMRSHQPVNLTDLIRRLRATEELAEMYAPGTDLVSVFLGFEKQIKNLTRQLEDARRMVVESGYFQNNHNYEYTMDLDNLWTADPVGPVAWEQVQQR